MMSAAPQTILIVASYAPSLINFRGPLIARLLECGHRVLAAAPDIDADTAGALSAMGAVPIETPLARNGLGPLGDLRYMARLRRVMAAHRPDLVLSYTIKPNVWAAFAAKSLGIRSVALVTGLGYAFTAQPKDTAVRRAVGALARRLYRAATDAHWRVIFQNPDDRDDFVAAGCLGDVGKARMVNGSGVDLTRYTPAPLPGRPVVLMISRLLGAKGVRDYAQACALLRARMPEVETRLVGPFDGGPDGVAQTELDDWVAGGLLYDGPAADVRPAIAGAQVYCLPSYREGTPRSVLEAMAMGRPVVTTDAPGCRGTVIDGQSGILVPVADPQALADALERLLRDPDLAQSMGQAGLSLAQDRFDVARVNDAMLAHMGLAEGGATP